MVLDTDILIDYAKGYAPWVNDVLKGGQTSLVLPTIVIAEYFSGVSLDDEYEQKVADRTFKLFEIQDLSEGVAKILGTILRHKSYPSSASTADLIVAATAIYLDCPLATRNKSDFLKIPDLRLFDSKKYD